MAYGFGYGLTIGRRSTAPFIGPLDAFAGQLYAVTGPHRALASYSGPCWRVRRSIDAGQEDIGFDSTGWVDKAWLADVAGGGSLYILRDYDKTGQGHDYVQASTGSQPRCVLNGVVDVGANGHPVAVFDGINDCMDMQDSAGFSRNIAATTYAAISRATGAGGQLVLSSSTSNATQARALIGYSPNATAPVAQARSTDVSTVASAAGAAVSSGAWARLIGRARYAAGGVDISVNGTTATNGAMSPAQNTPDTDAAIGVRVGAFTAGSLYLAGSVGTTVLARSAEDMAAFDAALALIMP